MSSHLRRRLLRLRQRQRWPWRANNQGELLVDGSRYFPAIFAALEQARKQILLECYYVSSGTLMDQLISRLLAARQRGVAVYLLLDAFGSRTLIESDRQRLQAAGVLLAFYNPLRLRRWQHNFARNHRKLLVIDGEQAFTGGTGLTDQFYYGDTHGEAWHELMLLIRGPVVDDWQRLFARTWQSVSRQPLALLPASGPCGNQLMRLATSAGPVHQGIKVDFRQQINHARQRVWLMTAYFLPSWSIRRALRRAARRGIDVRLLLPGPYTDHPWLYHAARRYYHQLLLAGVRIFEYQPRFVHAKAALCDEWLSIGSCNMDHWNLRWNLEANQEVQSVELADDFANTFEQDQLSCREITLDAWQRRPRGHRMLSFVIGYVSALLLRLFR